MSKKGRQLRQYKKQLRQIQKFEKRLQQKGVNVNNKVDNIQQAKQYKRDLKNQLDVKSTKNNTFKPSDKQLREAIKGRTARTFTPKQKSLPRQKVQSQTKPNVEQKRKQYTPPKEEQLRQERINTDSSFYSDAIIANYRNQLRQYPAMAEPMLTNWLDYMIDEHGKDDVAKMLEDGAKNGVVLTFEIAYSEDKLVGYIADLMDWLPEMTDWYKAELMEQFEMWEEIE